MTDTDPATNGRTRASEPPTFASIANGAVNPFVPILVIGPDDSIYLTLAFDPSRLNVPAAHPSLVFVLNAKLSSSAR
jgi:hypothetical protein